MDTTHQTGGGRITSLEAADHSWWVAARGGKPTRLIADDEDLRSIVPGGDIRVDQTPYPRRFVGYGKIAAVVTPADVIGTDEGSDQPILSDAAVMRLATLPGVTVRREA